MARHWRWITGVALLWISLAASRPAVWAQPTPPAARLTSPLPGAAVAGVVTLIGRAAAPQFLRYELAFAYDPDPTDTWFSIQPPAMLPVESGTLGQWDTTSLTPGLYVLRLRVYTSPRDYIETLVHGVRVQTTLVPSQAAPALTSAPATPEPTKTLAAGPTATLAPLIALPPAPSASPTPNARVTNPPGSTTIWPGLNVPAAQAAFSAGAQLTFIIFCLLGVYQGARALILSVWRRWRR